MGSGGPKAELLRLKRSALEFEKQFLTKHLSVSVPSLYPPGRKEKVDTAAYVVLVHGALENFFEGLALWTLGRIVRKWTTSQKPSASTVAILLHQPCPAPEQQSSAKVFD